MISHVTDNTTKVNTIIRHYVITKKRHNITQYYETSKISFSKLSLTSLSGSLLFSQPTSHCTSQITLCALHHNNDIVCAKR